MKPMAYVELFSQIKIKTTNKQIMNDKSSTLLFSPMEEPESLTTPVVMDTGTLEGSDIQIVQPIYVLFPSDPFDELDGILTPRFPYLPAPPGFTPIAIPDDILWPAGSTSIHDASPALRDPNLLELSLKLSPIDRIPSEYSMGCVSSSSSVASDDSYGDAGLLASLLGCSIGSVSRTSVSSEFSFYSAVDSPTGLPQAGPQHLVPRWRLAWEGPFGQRFLNRTSGTLAVDMLSATLHTGPQTLPYPPGSMGCHCTTLDFWNGSTLRSRLNYWIKGLVLGCTRCPVHRLTNFTGMCVS